MSILKRALKRQEMETLPTKKDIKKNLTHYAEIVKLYGEVLEKQQRKKQLQHGIALMRPVWDDHVAPHFEGKTFDPKHICILDFKDEGSVKRHAYQYVDSDQQVYMSYDEHTNPGGTTFYVDCELEVDRQRIYSRDGDGFVFMKNRPKSVKRPISNETSIVSP